MGLKFDGHHHHWQRFKKRVAKAIGPVTDIGLAATTGNLLENGKAVLSNPMLCLRLNFSFDFTFNICDNCM